MAKKGTEKKAKQTAIPRAKKDTAPKPVGAKLGSQAKFVSFKVRAVIPTQQYGNIQPEIEVTAPTFEEARAYAMPIIEDLYKQYAEAPLNGKEPRFYGKVSEEVRVVVPMSKPADVEVKKGDLMKEATTPPAPEAVDVPAPQATNGPAPVKPESVLKAEKAIMLAATEDAAVRIQDQIEKSQKIPQEFKAELLKTCLKRRTELEGK